MNPKSDRAHSAPSFTTDDASRKSTPCISRYWRQGIGPRQAGSVDDGRLTPLSYDHGRSDPSPRPRYFPVVPSDAQSGPSNRSQSTLSIHEVSVSPKLHQPIPVYPESPVIPDIGIRRRSVPFTPRPIRTSSQSPPLSPVRHGIPGTTWGGTPLPFPGAFGVPRDRSPETLNLRRWRGHTLNLEELTAVPPDIAFSYLAFLGLGASFVGFIWHCHHASPPAHLPGRADSDPKIRQSTMTILFSLWNWACFGFAMQLCSQSFGREWAARPQRTDTVSTITSGLVDHIFYASQPRATKTFKFTFLLSLLVIAAQLTGRSAIVLTPIDTDVDETLPITHVNPSVVDITGVTLYPTDTSNRGFGVKLDQAGMVMRLEQVHGGQWGYTPEPNWFIPLPSFTLSTPTRFTYETDLVSFHHSCQWKAPDSFSDNVVRVGNTTWTGNFKNRCAGPNTQDETSIIRNGSGIVPLKATSKDSTGTSAFLFLGGDTDTPVHSTRHSRAWIDLSGLPTTTCEPGGYLSAFTGFTDTQILVRAPLASILICDPRLEFMSGTILLNPLMERTAPNIKIQTTTSTTIGNVERSTARSVFSSILRSATDFYTSELLNPSSGFINFNSVAGGMFMALPPWPYDWEDSGSLRPLDPGTINNRVDSFTLSGLKVFTGGYVPAMNAEQNTYTVTTTIPPTARLKTMLPMAILHSTLFAVVALGLLVLVGLMTYQGRTPFQLEHLKEQDNS